MRVARLILLFPLLLAFAACGRREPTPKERVETILQQLAAEQYAEVHAQFDAKLGARISPAQLKSTWDTIVNTRGNFQECVVADTRNEQGLQAFSANCTFDKGMVRIRAAFNPDHTLSSLSFSPG
jgi:hypothetical protein